jgi:hypothetical protein
LGTWHAIDAQPRGQPDAPVHGFYLAGVVSARRLPWTLGVVMRVPSRFRDALISTVIAASLFAVFGNPSAFPGAWLGFAAFLAGVFLLALYLRGKLE